MAAHLAPAQDAAKNFVWWEGENPAATDATLAAAKAGNDALSGGQALAPKGGSFLEYEADVPSEGEWFFYVRKSAGYDAFRWRFNEQPWRHVLKFKFRGGRLPSDFLKSDQDWIEAQDRISDSVALDVCRSKGGAWSWMVLGRVRLAAGKHRLRMEPDGAALPAIDAFLLHCEVFTPRGAAKPDDPQPQEAGWWAFAPEGDRADGLALDLRALLNEPVAGGRGFIQVKDEAFVYPDTGEPVRFWATHLQPCEMPPELIEEQARFLARRGVNLVRIYPFHWRATGPESLEVDPVKIRRFQRAVAIFKRQGIYVKIGLYSGRVFNDLSAVSGFEMFKGKDWANPFMLHLLHEGFLKTYERWITELLTSENPYGPPLAKEPAILGIELQNESNTLWYAFQPKRFPPEIWAGMERRYADWLANKYGSVEAAWAAWNEKPSGKPGELLLLETWQLIAGPSPRRADQVRFYARIERDFYERTKALLKEAIGFGGLVLGSNWDTSNDALLFPALAWAEQPSDFIDHHFYFHTPGSKGGAGASEGTAAGHKLRGRTALRWEGLKPGEPIVPSGFLDLIRDGKPGMCSEYSWRGGFNRWRAEYPLFVAAQSRAGGMDAMADFQSGPMPGWAGNEVRWVNQNPAILGQFPAAALLFRTGLLAEGKTLAHMRVNAEDALDLRVALPVAKVTTGDANRAFNKAEDHPGAQTPKAEQGVYFSAGKVRLDVGPFPSTNHLADLKPYWDAPKKTLRHSNGQITWDYGAGIYRIDAPGANVALGFLGKAGPVELGAMRLETPMEFGAVALVSLDGKPLAGSGRMLLQVMSEQKECGQEIGPLAADGSFTVSGETRSPYMVRELAGTIHLKRPDAASLRVTPLKPNFTPDGEAARGAAVRLNRNTLYYMIEQ